MKQKYFWALWTLAATASACSPVQRCYQNADCESPMVCMPDGECDYKCRYDVECGNGFVCVAHECKPQLAGNLKCPKGMAPIQNTYCMDQYEASRPDATSRSAGEDSSMAMSRPGVMPWQVGKDNAAAKAACEAAGKRLCTPAEWEFSCHGTNHTVYGYGNDYEPETCNGLESFGKNNFHLVATGTFKNCHNGWDIYDLNGNVWEHTANGNAKTVRGGAYNCADSPTNHQCSYVPNNWTPSALGFRCCSDGIVEEETPEPGTPEPGTPEPGTPEPGTPEPGTPDPGTPDPGTPEPGTPEPDPGTPNPDPGTPEPGTPEPGTPEPGTPEPETPQYACPDDMVLITYGDFAACMDRYEAARSDATENFGGASTMPVSKAGVQPWYRPTFEEAVAACQSVGKHLCNADEWNAGCAGTDHKKYPYGNTYDPTICNGIDAYCACDSSSCAESNVCPFAHCYLSCGSNLRIMPTGAFENCTNDAGAYDISGNLWEFVDDGTGQPSVRGGAYNCIDSENLHQCSTIMPVNSINAYGFRCCKSPDIVDNADEVPQAQNISPTKIINFYHKFQEAQPPESFITSPHPIYE
ncbi:MAG: SUMF1/EgtB/PvdO family nonheme iron enzyme, partial [Proteobacteria bacterium]|nr:SUMF1/EgtB/PvdO family nonheme iron enzyme [Pseudomonadota bacterium]